MEKEGSDRLALAKDLSAPSALAGSAFEAADWAGDRIAGGFQRSKDSERSSSADPNVTGRVQ